jgi:hypothetical protein
VSETAEASRLRRREAQARLALVLAQALVLAWMMMPPHGRRLALMRLAAGSRRLLGTAARQAGRVSMGAELRTGAREYAIPEALSTMRDAAAAAYERLRSS